MQFHDDYDSALNSKYYLAGKRLGTHTSPMTPKQLEEFGKKLNEGLPNVEILTIKPEVFETIPEEHFKEIKRLSKITGANVSLHAPLIEPSGFEERRWSEQKRISNEKQIGNVLERAGNLGENIPVVLHGSNVFGQQWEKGLKTGKGEETYRAMRIVNEETGEMVDLQYDERERMMSEREREMEEKYHGLKEGKKIIYDPMRRLEMQNRTEWDRSVLDLFKFQHTMDEVQDRIVKKEMENLTLVKSNQLVDPNQKMRYERNDRDISIMSGHIKELNNNLRSHFDELYNKINKFSVGEDKEVNTKMIKKIKEEYENEDKGMNDLLRERQVYINKLNSGNISFEEASNKIQKILNEINRKEEEKSKILINGMQNIQAPEVWKPVKDFAIEKASETIAGAAFHAYEKFGKKAPILAIENSYPELAMSRAEDLKKGIEEARNKFVKKLIAEKGLSSDEAKEISKKLIGATWDIGHINLLRRAGYSEEELKGILKEETKKIGPVVKHVHITDNFGFNDTHLPPGMGNVPIKEMLEQLEKSGWEGRGILEVGGSEHELGITAIPSTLEYFGGSVYSGGPKFTPDIYGSSFGTYIEFPRQHFDVYGSGFSTLPKELGGEVGEGEKSRFMQESGNQ